MSKIAGVIIVALLCAQCFALGATVDLMKKGARIKQLEIDNSVKQAKIDLLKGIIDPIIGDPVLK